jgi:hypothetical protein
VPVLGKLERLPVGLRPPVLLPGLLSVGLRVRVVLDRVERDVVENGTHFLPLGLLLLEDGDRIVGRLEFL